MVHHERVRILLIGLGPRTEFDGERARVAAARAHTRARAARRAARCAGSCPHAGRRRDRRGAGQRHRAGRLPLHPLPAGAAGEVAARAADHQRPPRRLGAPCARAAVLAAAQNRARDLANTAPNDLTPTALADYARELAGRHDGLEVTVLDGSADPRPRHGRVRGRGPGQHRGAARLIELRYDPAGSDPRAPRLAMIGKAVTFDTGGLALKPAAADGGDEVRHVRRRGGDRGDRRPGRAQCPRPRARASSARWRTSPGPARSSPETSSRR